MPAAHPPPPRFPPHNGPRVWFLTSADAPVAIGLARQVLAHGDHVVACVQPGDSGKDDERTADFEQLVQDAGQWGGDARIRVVGLDLRCATHCWDCTHYGTKGDAFDRDEGAWG